MSDKIDLFDLTDAQVFNACLSYRHDYGLMNRDQQNALEFQCREWARALGHITPTTEEAKGGEA